MEPRDEAELVALVEAVRAEPSRRGELVRALREDAVLHAQKGRVAITRMRGWVLASFEAVGLPDEAIPFVVEELESGTEAYLVAAAARAVRGRPRPDPFLAPYVARAIGNIQGHDDLVTFSAFGAYAMPGQGETAVGELLATLLWMGAAARGARREIEALRDTVSGLSPEHLAAIERCLQAGGGAAAEIEDCCPGWLSESPARDAPPGEALRSLRLQDQTGEEASFEASFVGRPSIVAFFYSRCDNPRKCSLTITKLARAQRMLAEEGLLDRIATAAVTYDPGYDLPDRLLQYGRARGWIVHARHRLFRSTTNNDALIAHFQLGVGFIASLVNRHRLECFVLDAEGRTRRSFLRTQWDEREVVEAAKALLAGEGAATSSPAIPRPEASPPARSPRGWGGAALSILPSVMVALLPKCPVCWAAYMSMLGIAGFGRIPHSPWIAPFLGLLMLVNLASLRARTRRRSRLGFWLSAAGAVAILVGGWWLGAKGASLAGVILTVAGSLMAVVGPGEDTDTRAPAGAA